MTKGKAMTRTEEAREKLKGVGVVMMTSFEESEELNEAAIRENTKFLIDNGIKAGTGILIPTGSMGECDSLTVRERKRVMDIVVNEAKDEVPVVPGCIDTSTRVVIELAQHAQEVGADSVMIMAPHYWPAHEETSIKHFQAVAKEIDLGIMVYNNPFITGLDLSVATMKKLTEIENIVSMKECTLDFVKFALMVRELQGKLAIFNGIGETYEPYASMMGTAGFFSTVANFVPRIAVEIYKAALDKDYEKAQKLRMGLSSILDFIESSPKPISIIKEAMNVVGSPAGTVRLPKLSIDDEEKEKLRVILRRLVKNPSE